jgi:hypothetical protein
VITDETRGFWRVQTETAHYELDLDERTLVRLPGESTSDFIASSMRRDGEVIPLLQVLNQIVVGEDMYLLIQVREDGTSTVRRTTPVVDMERVLTTEKGR